MWLGSHPQLLWSFLVYFSKPPRRRIKAGDAQYRYETHQGEVQEKRTNNLGNQGRWYSYIGSSDRHPGDPKVYAGLRNLMLQGSRAKFGISPSSKPTQPYGVLMDWGIPAGSATVVAMADGNASVYLSSGGGFLGGGQSHESIRSAAKRTVEIADEVQPLMQPTTTYPIAQRRRVIFYVLTDAGVFTASASADDTTGLRPLQLCVEPDFLVLSPGE